MQWWVTKRKDCTLNRNSDPPHPHYDILLIVIKCVSFLKHNVVRVGNLGDAGFIKIETNSAQSWAWVELGKLINKRRGGWGLGGIFVLYIQHLFIVLYNIYSMYYTYTVLKQELD